MIYFPNHMKQKKILEFNYALPQRKGPETPHGVGHTAAIDKEPERTPAMDTTIGFTTRQKEGGAWGMDGEMGLSKGGR